MFLTVSKLLGILLSLSNLLVVVAAVAAFAMLLRRRRLGLALVWTAVSGFLLTGFGPVGLILIRPLEDRFPRPPNDMSEPKGIIVLGGTVALASIARGTISLTQDGERLSEAAILAHRYPNATVIISTGALNDRLKQTSEALISERFLVELGVDKSRITLEQRSLSTAENAEFTRELVMPQLGERWVLVTSASHMPRAVGAFRRVGFPVIPYPVGYTTAGLPADYWAFTLNVSGNFVRADIAYHEWLGLLAYWLTGRTDELLPSPYSDQD